MASSLHKLSSYLDNSQKFVTKRFCKDIKEFQLLQRKGIFPYEYVNNWEKLVNTQELPQMKDFF